MGLPLRGGAPSLHLARRGLPLVTCQSLIGFQHAEVLAGRYQADGRRLLNGDPRRGFVMLPAKIGQVLEVIRAEDRNAARRRATKRRTAKRHTLPKQRQPE